MKAALIKVSLTVSLILMGLNVKASESSLEFNVKVGKQESDSTLTLGFDHRVYQSKSKTGMFALSSIEYTIVDSDGNTLRKSELEYKFLRNDRRDTVIKVGTGYDFGKIDIMGFIGLGNSRVDRIDTDMVKECQSCQYKTKSFNGKVNNQLKQEVGLRLSYELGNRDINPFIEATKVKYGSEEDKDNISLGVSFGF